MKQCSRCKEWKEEVEYGKLKSSKDGLNCWCKSCRYIYYKSDAFKETIKKYQQSSTYKEGKCLYDTSKYYNIPKEFIPQEVKDLIKIKVENLKQLKQLKNETK